MCSISMKSTFLFMVLFFVAQLAVAQSAMDQAFSIYDENKTLNFDTERGQQLWNKKNIGEDGKERSCNTCHGKDFTKPGKHVKTEKTIEPMAPSVNNERFIKLKKIKKWFKRNCKWTYGRECTNQEKGDLLTFLSQQ